MTTGEKNKLNQVVHQEIALKVYLDALLDEDRIEVEQVKVEPMPAPPVVEAPKVTPIRPAVVEPVVAVEPEPVEIPPSTPVSDDSWAEGEFDCLVFHVAGFLSLAVPLVKLNGIVPWEDEVTPMPGYADWMLGILPHRGQQVKVIDIARFVIPENHQARAALSEEGNFKHVVMVGEGQWGLACDSLGDVLRLSRGKVRWRDDRSQRPWLAGMVIDQMCALLDVDRFVEMLRQTGPKESGRS